MCLQEQEFHSVWLLQITVLSIQSLSLSLHVYEHYNKKSVQLVLYLYHWSQRGFAFYHEINCLLIQGCEHQTHTTFCVVHWILHDSFLNTLTQHIEHFVQSCPALCSLGPLQKLVSLVQGRHLLVSPAKCRGEDTNTTDTKDRKGRRPLHAAMIRSLHCTVTCK